MKKFLTFMSALALLLPFAATALAETLDEARTRLAAEFPNIEPGDIYETPVDGWYEIRRGAILAYISADGRFLMQGDLIDLEAQVNLSAQARDRSRNEMMASISDDDAIVFSPKEVRYRVDIFTDIDCGYCRRLHNQIDQYLEHGIEVRYLLYPRNGPTSPSWAKAERVWCANDRNEALTLAKQDKTFQSRQCDSGMVSRHYALGRDVGLTGTPAIVLEDGSLVSGWLPPEALAERLQASAN